MIRRTIREWERMSYGTDESELPASHADQLAAEARASTFSGLGGEGVLEHGRKGVRARGVVGVIATPDCQLEILPKIEGAGESSVDDATLRHRLIHMLAMARDIRIDTGAITQLAWQRETLLELLVRLYCSKLADAVRQGIPQQYIRQQDGPPHPARESRCDAAILDSSGLHRRNWLVDSMHAHPTLHSIRSCGRPSANFPVLPSRRTINALCAS